MCIRDRLSTEEGHLLWSAACSMSLSTGRLIRPACCWFICPSTWRPVSEVRRGSIRAGGARSASPVEGPSARVAP
eukprot:4099074-Pyramimonas_sp.AAC.1